MKTTRLPTFSEPCPYVAGKTSIGEYLPGEALFRDYEALIPLGWRRSGNMLYRYRCEDCSLCIPIRLRASKILAGKRFGRLKRVNRDISIELLPANFRRDHFTLYEKYIRTRHKGTFSVADTSDSSLESSYRGMLEAPMAAISEYRDASGKLCATGFLDILPNGLSSVYFSFDPDEGRRSLGSYSIFAESEMALRRGIEYYYLGFWVPRAATMDYKADFPPFQLSVPGENGREAGGEPPIWKEFPNKSAALSWLSAISHR